MFCLHLFILYDIIKVSKGYRYKNSKKFKIFLDYLQNYLTWYKMFAIIKISGMFNDTSKELFGL